MKYIIALLFLIGGGFFIIYGIATIKDSYASSGWPSVDGRIVQSEVRDILVKRPPNKTNLTERKYTPVIVFEYEVKGEKYQAKTVAFDDTATRQRSKIDALVAKYPIDSQHKVFYKPANPKLAVLEPGLSKGALLFPVIGLVMLLFGVVALKAVMKRRTRL